MISFKSNIIKPIRVELVLFVLREQKEKTELGSLPRFDRIGKLKWSRSIP